MSKTYRNVYYFIFLIFPIFLTASSSKKRGRASQFKVANVEASNNQKKVTDFFKRKKVEEDILSCIKAPEIPLQQADLEDDLFQVESNLPDELTSLQNAMINALNAELVSDFLALFNECITQSDDGSAILEIDKIIHKETLLLWAARHNASELASILVSNGATIDLSLGDISPLYEAARLGLFPFCQLLIDNGAHVKKDYRYKNELHKAAKDQNKDFCELLASTIDDCDKTTSNGYSALSYAAQQGNAELCGYLLSRNAFVNRATNAGISVLMLACMSRSFETVQLLIESGAHTNTVSNEGDTAVHYAVKSGSAVIVDLLLKKGASAKLKNNNGETALHTAAIFQHNRVAYLILLHAYSLRRAGVYELLLSLKKSKTDEDTFVSAGSTLLYKERSTLVKLPIEWLLENEAQAFKDFLKTKDNKQNRAYDYLKNRFFDPMHADKLIKKLLSVTVPPLLAITALEESQKTQQTLFFKDGKVLISQ